LRLVLDRCRRTSAEEKAKWDKVALTKNPEERLGLMGEFLRIVPKCKSREQMFYQIVKTIFLEIR
jgi:hypothetical protein